MAAGLAAALLTPAPAPSAPAGTAPGRRPPRTDSMRVWRTPAVLFAIALISVTFFGDGALQSFLSTYLQRTLTATAAGYTAFIISPLTIGLLAQVTGLRLALSMLILTSLAIACLATRWPSALTRTTAAALIGGAAG